MGYTVILLAALIGGAGLIAYVGDLLGRRMGKARLSLLGLRPRHTAIVVTSITGMLIAAFTLGLLLAVNREYTRVVLEGPKVLAENRRLQRETARLEERRRNAVETAEKALASTREAEASLAKARESLRKATDDLLKARRTEAELDRKIREQQGRLKDYEKRLAAEQARLAQARRDVAKAQEDIRKATRILAEQNRLVVQAQQRAGITLAGYRELRERPIIFFAGEEVARVVVDYSPRLSDIRANVYRALEIASSKAEGRGAKKGPNGRAVIIAPAVFRDVERGREERFQEPQSVAAIAEQIHESRESVVMQITAPGNSIAGETVPVAVRLYRNKPILSAGDLLACVNLDGRLSNQIISQEVREFLATDVRAAAARADLIPRLKAGGEPVYFEMDVDRLAALVADIREAKGPVRLCARARGPVTSAGPLELDFTVQKR